MVHLSSTLGLLLAAVAVTSALRFNVPANQKRCLKEEIHKNLVVTGEYEITEGIGYTASVHVSIIFMLFFPTTKTLIVAQIRPLLLQISLPLLGYYLAASSSRELR